MHIGRPTLAGFLRTRFQWTTLALIRMDSSACSSALEAVRADAPFGAASVAPRASGAGVLPGEKTITEGLKFALQQKHLVFRLAKDISGKLVQAPRRSCLAQPMNASTTKFRHGASSVPVILHSSDVPVTVLAVFA